MNVTNKTLIVLAVLLSLVMSNSVWADEAALTQRIERLERIIQGQGLVSLLGRVDQLQKEVQRLNGDNESLRHQIETMKKNQRERYLDLDQRVEKLSATATLVPVPAPVTPIIADVSEPAASAENVPAVEPAVDTAIVDNTPAPETLPVAVENGEAAYQSALQTLRSGQYEQAVMALEKFPADYPQSSYLPNAYYWQGEANYVLRDFDKAIIAFTKVVNDFPASSKVADASLKLGFSQYENGQFEVAKTTLASVVNNYPNTSAARLAKVRLDRINKESN
ncbi:MAG: tol-pal system protein YbgF [Methylophaga sp.]|nr:MAG: tol-pal system protein YbgF [Methylophaga sp.]